MTATTSCNRVRAIEKLFLLTHSITIDVFNYALGCGPTSLIALIRRAHSSSVAKKTVELPLREFNLTQLRRVFIWFTILCIGYANHEYYLPFKTIIPLLHVKSFKGFWYRINRLVMIYHFNEQSICKESRHKLLSCIPILDRIKNYIHLNNRFLQLTYLLPTNFLHTKNISIEIRQSIILTPYFVWTKLSLKSSITKFWDYFQI